jgi:hypothetical protein
MVWHNEESLLHPPLDDLPQFINSDVQHLSDFCREHAENFAGKYDKE